MENEPTYSASSVSIPESILVAYHPDWTVPDAHQVRAACDMAGLNSGAMIARLVGVSPRTVRKWLGGQERIPYASWAIICFEANLGMIWRNK